MLNNSINYTVGTVRINKKTGLWDVNYRLKDSNGNICKKTSKRGFKTKHQGQDWLDEKTEKWKNELLRHSHQADGMTMYDLVEMYREYFAPRFRKTTDMTKNNIINNWILPYLGDDKILNITPLDIIAWQNKVLEKAKVNDISQTYLHSIHSQLSSIFNFAIKTELLTDNPAKNVGSLGKKR